MNAPAQSLRCVFALSMFACANILVLFVRGRAAWTTQFWVGLVATAAVVAAAICWVAFRQGKMRLVGVSWGCLLRVFLFHLVFVYLASATAMTGIAMAVVYAATRSAPNSFALAVLAGLWLALWLAPGIAAVTSWRRLRDATDRNAPANRN